MNIETMEEIATEFVAADWACREGIGPIGDIPGYLDRGAFRKAYLRDGYVFKVPNFRTSNIDEWKTYEQLLLKELPDDIRLPETHIVSVDHPQWDRVGIIVMEFIDGRESIKEEYYHVGRHTGLQDVHSANVLVTEDGIKWPIDMQL